jgi:hypothetical protein
MVDVSIKLNVLIKICLKNPSVDIMYNRLVQFPFRAVLKRRRFIDIPLQFWGLVFNLEIEENLIKFATNVM